MAFVQGAISQNGSSAAPLSLPFSSNVGAGNAVVVFVVHLFQTPEITITPSDSQGNKYYSAGQVEDQSDGLTILAFVAFGVAAGALTVTITQGVSDTITFAILEHSGVNTLWAVSGRMHRTPTTTTGDAGKLFLGGKSCDLIAGFTKITSDTHADTAGTGFTMRESDPNSNVDNSLSVESSTSNITADTTPGVTFGASVTYLGLSLALTNVAAGGGGLLRNPGTSGGVM